MEHSELVSNLYDKSWGKKLADHLDKEIEKFVWEQLGFSPYIAGTKIVKPIVVEFLKDYKITYETHPTNHGLDIDINIERVDESNNKHVPD